MGRRNSCAQSVPPCKVKYFARRLLQHRMHIYSKPAFTQAKPIQVLRTVYHLLAPWYWLAQPREARFAALDEPVLARRLPRLPRKQRRQRQRAALQGAGALAQRRRSSWNIIDATTAATWTVSWS